MTNDKTSREATEEEVKQMLRDRRDTAALSNSSWLESCLVSEYLEREPDMSSVQALIQVLDDILKMIEEESAEYGEILRGRFWEGQTVKKMVVDGRPQAWSERTFHSRQRGAIKRFTELLIERESMCRQEAEEQAESISATSLTLDTSEGSGRSLSWGYGLAAAVGLILLIGVVFWQIRSSATLPQPSSPSVIKSPATIKEPTLPEQVTALDVVLCDELKQIAASWTDRFIRHQGVSAFTMENTEGGVLNNRVRTLAMDESGLWVGYHATDQNTVGGIGQYNKSEWMICDASAQMENANVNDIAIDKEGNVWIAFETAGVAVYDGDRFLVYSMDDGLPSNKTYGLTIDDMNNVWGGTWEGVAKFDGKVWSVPYSVHNGTIFNNHVHTLAFDGEGNVWVGHIGEDDGVSQFRNKDGKWVHHTTEVSGNRISDIVVRPGDVNSPESIWFATGNGVSKFEKGRWTVYTVKDGIPGNQVRAVAVDHFNRVWAATEVGVAYFDDVTWTTYNTIDTLSIAFGIPCESCVFDGDHVWTGTAEFGLTHSRIPYPEDALDVVEACFEAQDENRVCLPLDEVEQTEVITVSYPGVLAPGDMLRTEIIVAPLSPRQLREDRGDFLSNIDDNDESLFGAWKLIPVKGVIDPGQRFIFTDYDNPFVAPNLPDDIQEKEFVSTWRVWMHTRYVGPKIHIAFTVSRATTSD